MIASEPARTRSLWAILSLVLPDTFGGHITVCRSPALTFYAAIHITPRSAVLRLSPSPRLQSSIHWSALIPKALRLSSKHPIYFFPDPPRSLRPSQLLRTSRPHFDSIVSSMRATNSAKKIRFLRIVGLDALTFRLDTRGKIGNRVVGAIVLSPTMQQVRKLWWVRQSVS